MKKKTKHLIALILAFVVFLSTFNINSYSVDHFTTGLSVIVTNENGIPASDVLVTISIYEDNKWINIFELSSNDDGKVIYDLSEEYALPVFYKLSLSAIPDNAIYAFVSANGKIAYSKQFNESTYSLGDGANYKIKTLRYY